MINEQEEQVSFADLGLWYGKTSLEHSAATKVRTSESSSKKPQRSQTPKFLYLDLRAENGLMQGALWETDSLSLGESSMLNISECPSVGVESHLSQILEETPHPKYSLSPRACQGILNRAERRGKELPEMLKEALIRQAGLSAPKNEQDAQGGAKESLSSPIEQEHCQQSIISECCGISGDKAGTLDASYYKGTGARSGKEREVVCYGISAYDSNSMKAVYSIENHPNDSRCRIDPNGKVQSLSSRMGTGGNNTPMCMTYGLDRASYNQGQNAKFDFSVEEEKIGAQTARGPGAIYHSVVRRLTPLECERLQGYPDYWTHIGDWTDGKGKKHKDADSPKYKALGNSIAVCCWRFILRNINEYCTEHTMASLFDGIAGFCLIWYELGGNIRFVSEIEEYPIAVCKKHFGDEDIGKVGDIENYIKRR